MTVVHTDHIADPIHGDYDEIWHTTPPDDGVLFVVVAQQFDRNGNRHIYHWETA